MSDELPTPDFANNMRLIGHSDMAGRPDGAAGADAAGRSPAGAPLVLTQDDVFVDADRTLYGDDRRGLARHWPGR